MARGAIWHVIKNSAPAPLGLILGYRGTSLPAGWTHVNGENRHIMGTTGTPGGNGGSSRIGSWKSSGGGNHGSANGTRFTRASGGAADTAHNSSWSSKGNHDHTAYADYTPAKANITLMQASDDLPIPPSAIGFGAVSAMEGFIVCSDLVDSNRYLCGNSGVSNPSVSGASSSGSTSNSSFSHFHHGTGNSTSPGGAYGPDSQSRPSGGPSHGHGVTLSLSSISLKAYVLNAFEAIEEMGAPEGLIGLWLQSGVPDGWVLCDGNNGTPDLNGRIIRLASSGFGPEGNGTISGSGSLKSAGSHNHSASKSGSEWQANYSHDNNVSHSHSFSFGATAYSPPHKTFKFIQRAP